MTRPNRGSWFTLAALGLAALGCEAGGVGDPCTPEDEYQQDFSGYSDLEVNTESRSFQCETRLCLVNHFKGRASCPYGQTADMLPGGSGALPPDHPDRCKIPGTSGTDPIDEITAPVAPQRTGRRAEDTVYCSCRCANAEGSTDDGARYCECPSGYDCEKLVDDLGLGKAQLAGSYCIKQGTKYNPTRIGTPCSRSAANCGE